MTFEKAAWAINGPILGSSLARRAVYASGAKASGIVQATDLQVVPLATPGVGIRINAGVGLVLNGYQSSPNETYVVSNPDVHTMSSEQMPASNPSSKSYIVAIVVGDPDFAQTGHPWMSSSDPAPGTESTFTYVRPTLIEVSSGAKTISGAYPALVLARIDVPANTTTISSSMITDLRKLSTPRQTSEVFTSPQGTYSAEQYMPLAPATVGGWGTTWAPQVTIPTWAKRMVIVTSIDGVGLVDCTANITGTIRVGIPVAFGPVIGIDTPVLAGAQRFGYNLSMTTDVTNYRGTTQAIQLQAQQTIPVGAPVARRLKLMSGSVVTHDVRFYEE